MITGVVPITDSRGSVLLPYTTPEPEPGSVVLVSGEYGTAWQRYFSDGKWHRVGGGRAKTWEQLLTERNLVLIYDAPFRGE